MNAPLLRRMPVSHPNKSDPNTLPDPELNPLLNPLLAAHMGRWAEVYFTNPPEKRDQAVSELLRELENIPASETASVEDVSDEGANKITEIADSPNWSSSESIREPFLTCNECAYDNSPDHEFCGMCGAPLVEWAERGQPHLAGAAPIGESWCERTLSDRSMEDSIHAASADPIEAAVSPTAAVASREATELRAPIPELRPKLVPTLLPKPLPNKDPRPAVESLPRFYGFYRYHLYLGAVLAVVLVVVGFMAWRGRNGHSRAAASPAVSALRQAQPAPVNSAQPPGTTATASPATGHSPIASPAQNRNQASASPPENHAADSRTAPQSVPLAVSSPAAAAPALPQSGAEELATAEKYLNPSNGTARDSGEAAEWLWKAVRKRNLDATLALSDLYVRGDGVAKSCDQARLLLDAAARKGGKAAAERLRNLQAFGCQ
jgi:hypothetical protein